ncbi:MAG: hypothetical protein E7634_07885 [Ruminococcaceae bacterium]|nr:hypothetical protein [Oscillospiraceae bacterium]
MGKFIQPNGRQAVPIFPQMPGVQQRMGSPQAPYDKRKKPQDEKPEKAPIMQERPVPKKKEEAPKQSASKRMTVNDLRNGFKMSVIIGEPVSRKYRRHK